MAAVLLSTLLIACDASAPQAQGETGSIAASIKVVPTDVACIRLTVTGARTVVRTYDVAPGQSVTLNLSGLPIGSDTFLGEGFSGACSTVTNLSVPNWLTDSVVANVSTSSPPRLILEFHQNGRAVTCADWQGDATTLIRLTSVTLDPENSAGATTNAPGAWSTNTADPLSQLLVIQDGVQENVSATTSAIGELSLPLHPGLNALTLVGNLRFPGNPYYGAVLFFDYAATPPQVAVYGGNGGTGSFSVQPQGTQIMGGANGGLFFDKAPGTSTYTAADGTKVSVVSFSINSTSTAPATDMVSFGEVVADANSDTVAQLVLNVVPPGCASIQTCEVVSIPTDGSSVSSKLSYPTSSTVALQVSGEVVWGGCDLVNCPDGASCNFVRLGDAQFHSDNCFTGPNPTFTTFSYPIQLFVNGGALPATPFFSNHVYAFSISGVDGPFVFRYNDIPGTFADNSGSFSATICSQ